MQACAPNACILALFEYMLRRGNEKGQRSAPIVEDAISALPRQCGNPAAAR